MYCYITVALVIYQMDTTLVTHSEDEHAYIQFHENIFTIGHKSVGFPISDLDILLNVICISSEYYILFFSFFLNNIILYCLTRLLTQHLRCPGKQNII